MKTAIFLLKLIICLAKILLLCISAKTLTVEASCESAWINLNGCDLYLAVPDLPDCSGIDADTICKDKCQNDDRGICSNRDCCLNNNLGTTTCCCRPFWENQFGIRDDENDDDNSTLVGDAEPGAETGIDESNGEGVDGPSLVGEENDTWNDSDTDVEPISA